MRPMSGVITIAHLSDLHLGPIAGFGVRYWNLKRASGYYNWSRRRHRIHRREIVDRLVADMLAQGPDHIAVTGDLVNIGLPEEHVQALAWLEQLGPPDRVTVVPGNHDIYSGIGRDPGTRRWAAYMCSDAQGATFTPTDCEFPFVRVLGRVALVGANSAVRTPPMIAWGRMGRKQLAALAGALAALSDAQLFRVLLIHHPPLPGQCPRNRGLIDAAGMQSVLSRCGAELTVHGHNHVNTLVWTTGPAGAIPIVGVPSASIAHRHRDEPLGGYNLYRIDPAERSILLIGRGLVDPDGPVVELLSRQLSPPGAMSAAHV
jgi:3',5'-cyclic AMP phosphodiesterase CpdA